MNAVIIDDEAHARQSIRTIIESETDEVTIVGEAANVIDAIRIIDEKRPDLLFLDIDLPDGNSFDILKNIRHRQYEVIFITAFQEYAIQAIKISAFDYILKPYNPVELIASVKKALKVHYRPNEFELKLNAFFSNINQLTPSLKKIVIKTSDKVHVVDIKNIIRCASDNSYCTIYTNNGKKIVVSKSIKYYDELLSPMGFMRVHQSHLINCNYINYFNKQDGGSLVMSDNSDIPVSISKKQVLTAYLESL